MPIADTQPFYLTFQALSEHIVELEKAMEQLKSENVSGAFPISLLDR